MIFLALVMSIGLPFVLLGSTSPLLQVWLARLEHGRIPFRLFALSNLASLLALALYPTLVEPYLTLRMQRDPVELWLRMLRRPCCHTCPGRAQRSRHAT